MSRKTSNSGDGKELTLTVYHQTDAALLIDDEQGIWLPKSQVDVIKQQGGKWTVWVPQWLIDKYELD